MVNTRELISKIRRTIGQKPNDAEAYNDWYSAIVGICKPTDKPHENADYQYAHEQNRALLHMAADRLKHAKTPEQKAAFYDLYRKALRYDAPDRFDSFLLYLELDRDAEKRFYQPRRKQIKRFVDALQDLEDDKLDELHLSCPPRIGKTSLIIFFMIWVMGRDSERSNLYCSYSDTITSAFYNGTIEILTDAETYHFSEIFPQSALKTTNAKEEYLDIDRKKHYHSLTCRSLYGTLNGACDASGYIIADDLISGIEEALNKDRLKSAWDKVNNNLLTRAKQRTKILFIGTRWSLADPIGVRRDMLENDEKYAYIRHQIIDIPALDENDKSNFDYDYNVGFSTEVYHARRASFERTNDLASWDAGYMQKPVERSGSLFEPDVMRYYNGELPDAVPDCIVSVTDPAYGGGDYVAAPMLFVYGSDVYVHDVVFSNADKKVTIPMCADMLMKYGVTRDQVEGTKSTSGYADELSAELKRREYTIHITTKAASTRTSKQDRIYAKAPEIRDSFIFRTSGCRSKDYQAFMEQVFAFKIIGKNVHDDAPDSLAMAADMIFSSSRKVEVFRRNF